MQGNRVWGFLCVCVCVCVGKRGRGWILWGVCMKGLHWTCILSHLHYGLRWTWTSRSLLSAFCVAFLSFFTGNHYAHSVLHISALDHSFPRSSVWLINMSLSGITHALAHCYPLTALANNFPPGRWSVKIALLFHCTLKNGPKTKSTDQIYENLQSSQISPAAANR